MNETIQTPPRSFERMPSEPTAESKTEQFVVTRNAATGDVVSIETIDSLGQRAAISDEKSRDIVGEDEFAELAEVLDDAFDTGATMLFDDAAGEEESAGEFERAALLRALLVAVAGPGASRRLANARKKLLHKLILRRLVRRYFLRHGSVVS